jgi:hypothetical protein
MPVVPFVQRPPSQSFQLPGPAPDEQWTMMAAAQMHGEGRLVQKTDFRSDWFNNGWEDTWEGMESDLSRIPKDKEILIDRREGEGKPPMHWYRDKPNPEDKIS